MSNIQVIKRTGYSVDFDKLKIYLAIKKAMTNGSGLVKDDIALLIAKDIEECLEEDEIKIVTIAQIEEMVFNKLVEYGQGATARAYENYRTIHEYQRQINTTDSIIGSIIDRSNEAILNENSNKDAIINSTQRDLIAGEISKDIAKRKLIPARLVQAHNDGAIHIHDMDYIMQPMTNCCLINIGDMLDNGTVINKKMIRSPRSFRVACTVMTQIIAQVASNQYGGQSVDIKHLAKYVERSRQKLRKTLTEAAGEDASTNIDMIEKQVEALVKKEIKDGVQTIQYQVNTLMTTNGQAPFITIFLNMQELSSEQETKDLYSIIREILNQRIEGIENRVGVKITTAFPKLVYVINENTCKDGKWYILTKLAAVSTAKRMYPDYISEKKMSEIYEGNVFSPMGCRSLLPPWKDKDGNYQFEGRFNFGVQTINLPQIAILSGKDKQMFFNILDTRLKLIKEMGLLRYNLLKNQLSDVSPIHWQYGAIARLKQGERIGELFLDGYATVSVGYIGLHEAVFGVLGESITTEEGHEFAMDILRHIQEQIIEWRKETRLYFSIYGTPSESTAGRLCEIDVKNFGIKEGINDKGYYTNSYHVTPSEEIDAFNKLKLEADFQTISTGGCISYIEIPNVTNNPDVIETIIDFMYKNISYAEFNTKSDYCQVCGYDGEIIVNDELQWECPQCHNKDVQKMNVIRRTCGYLGENFWSKGRTKDIKDRVMHI